MVINKIFRTILCTAAAGFSLNANAILIDFEDVGVLHPVDYATVTSGGFDFTNGDAWNSIPDIHFDTYVGSTIEVATHGDLKMTKNGGGLFDLSFFDMGGPNGEGATFTVVGTLFGGGIVSQIFNFDGNASTMETFNLSGAFTNLTQANWLHTGGNIGGLAVDNISTSTVSEPAIAWLLGTGLIGIIGAARRKNKL